MDVSVIIINYNTFKITADCIRSVSKHTHLVSYEIILVDNASTECDASLFLDEFPSIQLIKSDRNGGFAYGNNLGIKQATGQYILLLNSDTLLEEDSISKSVHFFRSHPGLGVLGCRMVYEDGAMQVSARAFKSIKWELLNLFKIIPFLLPYRKRARMMLGKYFKHNEDLTCEWVTGAFFMFPRQLIYKLAENKLDDRFFMYGEDHLWCWQIKKIGYSVVFFAGTTITHLLSRSTNSSKQLAIRKIMMKHELEIMKLRKGNGIYFLVYKLIYIFIESSRNLVKRIAFFFTGKIPRF